jgi:hypothetical protein
VASAFGRFPDTGGWVYFSSVSDNFGEITPSDSVYKMPNFGGLPNLLTQTEVPFAIDNTYFYYVSGTTIRRRPK